MTKVVSACLVLALASANFALGGDSPKAEADLKREAATGRGREFQPNSYISGSGTLRQYPDGS